MSASYLSTFLTCARVTRKHVGVASAGQLLGTVGRFTKAAAPAPEAAELADTAAALLQLPAVAGHPEPHVRRNALFAATQVLRLLCSHLSVCLIVLASIEILSCCTRVFMTPVRQHDTGMPA